MNQNVLYFRTLFDEEHEKELPYPDVKWTDAPSFRNVFATENDATDTSSLDLSLNSEGIC